MCVCVCVCLLETKMLLGMFDMYLFFIFGCRDASKIIGAGPAQCFKNNSSTMFEVIELEEIASEVV